MSDQGSVDTADQPKVSQENESFTIKVAAGVLIAVIPAAFGYLASFADGLRKDELATVSQQIEKLYGPLYALVQANNVAWNHFKNAYWPKDRQYYFDSKHPATKAEVSRWRLWMRSVFQPLNVQMEGVIVGNAQLIVGNGMPYTFRDMVAHAEGYKAVIAAWSYPDGLDSIPNTTDINYPTEIYDCVAGAYAALQSHQQALRHWSGLFVPMKDISDICPAPGWHELWYGKWLLRSFLLAGTLFLGWILYRMATTQRTTGTC